MWNTQNQIIFGTLRLLSSQMTLTFGVCGVCTIQDRTSTREYSGSRAFPEPTSVLLRHGEYALTHRLFWWLLLTQASILTMLTLPAISGSTRQNSTENPASMMTETVTSTTSTDGTLPTTITRYSIARQLIAMGRTVQARLAPRVTMVLELPELPGMLRSCHASSFTANPDRPGMRLRR